MASAAGPPGTPQRGKLGIEPGQRVSIDHAPPGWALEDPPGDLSYVRPAAAADLVISFFSAAAQLPERLPDLARSIRPAGSLWVAWPRRAGGHRSDLTDELIRAQLLRLGLVDVKVAAIDADWSGLKAVWRLEKRRHQAAAEGRTVPRLGPSPGAGR